MTAHHATEDEEQTQPRRPSLGTDACCMHTCFIHDVHGSLDAVKFFQVVQVRGKSAMNTEDTFIHKRREGQAVEYIDEGLPHLAQRHHATPVSGPREQKTCIVCPVHAR
eukprot:scaffold8024_cov430-Prasinococcus_capsulatus_cf.AAC.1